ncbi:hypothetical protein CLF_102580 [Clonorchis sinensis]|uniref:Uncharacterized protein n=1 Tax=Clonorchis sinensis TaxID=79923 RepID=G7Y860_CLOSI|nr:hypothetical protein CLF_102580 [Clonorchis sinensis]
MTVRPPNRVSPLRLPYLVENSTFLQAAETLMQKQHSPWSLLSIREEVLHQFRLEVHNTKLIKAWRDHSAPKRMNNLAVVLRQQRRFDEDSCRFFGELFCSMVYKGTITVKAHESALAELTKHGLATYDQRIGAEFVPDRNTAIGCTEGTSERP